MSQNAWLLISCIIHNDNSCKGMSHNHLLVGIGSIYWFFEKHLPWTGSKDNSFVDNWPIFLVNCIMYIYILESNPFHRFFFLSERERVCFIRCWFICGGLMSGCCSGTIYSVYLNSIIHQSSFSIHIVQSHLSWMLCTVKSVRSKKINNSINMGILVVYCPHCRDKEAKC